MKAACRCALALLALLLILPEGCSLRKSTDADSITVYCGAASKPAMQEIASLFEEESGIPVTLIYGGSGTLLSQLELSRQGEIYLPGSPDYILIGTRKKLLIEGSDRIVAYLVPAILTPAGNPAGIHALEDLARPGVRVGIGNPETVCLGLYGIEILDENDLLAPVMKNVVTFGGSCSKTANLVSMNLVDAILGWRVFHSWNPSLIEFVPIAGERIPRLSHISISIPVCTKDPALSHRFIHFVLSDRGREIYTKHGYITDLETAQTFAPRARVGGVYSLPPEYFSLLKDMHVE
jgi:molybdate transport system substrate-binding protein